MISFREFTEKKNVFKKLIDQYGKYKVFSVNGQAVRNSSKQLQEFGGSSIHAYLSAIPKDEIWIEDDIKPEERVVLIASALHQLKSIAGGMSVGKAYDVGLKKEKDYRDSAKLSRKKPCETDKRAPKEIYVKKYGHIKDDDIDVWLVDGEAVRNEFKTDYIEGAHGYVYSFTPNNEIWIEESPHAEEFPYILLHEYVERTLMKYKKTPYDKAHVIAAKVEWTMRCNTTGGINEGYCKSDALSLTQSEALWLARKH